MSRRRPRPELARWCEHRRCERLAVVLATDLEGFQAWLCRDHWHHHYRRTNGAIHAVQIITGHWKGSEWD